MSKTFYPSGPYSCVIPGVQQHPWQLMYGAPSNQGLNPYKPIKQDTKRGLQMPQ